MDVISEGGPEFENPEAIPDLCDSSSDEEGGSEHEARMDDSDDVGAAGGLAERAVPPTSLDETSAAVPESAEPESSLKRSR